MRFVIGDHRLLSACPNQDGVMVITPLGESAHHPMMTGKYARGRTTRCDTAPCLWSTGWTEGRRD